jgi:type I restriction enzyme M protein
MLKTRDAPAETESRAPAAASSVELGSTLRESLNALHETLYRRGGIRPVNAAIEELSKIVLLQLKNARDPEWKPNGGASISEILDPARVQARSDASEVKDAFSKVICLRDFDAILPDGSAQPVWPSDEPFRLGRPDVLAAGLAALEPTVLRTAMDSEDYDVLGTAFDALLRGRYDHGGGLATYLTPHGVAAMLAKLSLTDLEVPSGWNGSSPVFADPCCGTGRFLVAGLREARRIAEHRYGSGSEKATFLDGFGGAGIVGADQASASVAKARLNLLLFGVKSPCVFQVTDSIVDPTLDGWRNSVRLILTNPPFGDSKYDDPAGVERTRSVLRKLGARRLVDPGLAFLVRCLDLLDDDGRLGIILPDGLVDGAALRSALLGTDSTTRLSDVTIEANISLPTATFSLSGTVAKTSALVLRKGGARRTQVLLARAEHVGYLKQANSAIADPEGDDLPRIGELLAEHLPMGAAPDSSKVSVLSDSPSVVTSPYEGLNSVDPARLDPAALTARTEILAEGGQLLAAVMEPAQAKSGSANDGTPFVSILHVDEFGAIAWHHARQYRPTTPGRTAREGQLLVSLLNPKKLRTTVIPAQESVLCSAEFGIFDTADPWAIAVLLNDPRVRAQLSPLGRGTSSSRRRIDYRELFEVAVPPITAEVRRRGRGLEEAHRTLRSGEELAASALGLTRPT